MRSKMREFGTIMVLVVAAAGWLVSAHEESPSDNATKVQEQQIDVLMKSGEYKDVEPTRHTEPTIAKKNTATREDDNERAIRASADRFVEAYNAHDAKALAALFAPKAEFIDEDGAMIQGREAIEKSFSELFAEHPGAVIAVTPHSIRILTENIAVEEGALDGSPEEEGDPCQCSYVAVHTKIDGEWLVASVRDFAGAHDHDDNDDDAGTPGDHLQELAWMIGEWIDESPDSTIRSVVRWDDSENYILHDFSAFVGGEIAMTGQMRIGWDPLTRQFKAWVFDSGGGFTEGLWIREGHEWIVKWQGVTSDGEPASSTSIYRQVDDDTIGWSSIDRVVDGEQTENVDEVIMKRCPPSPGEKL